MKLTRKAASAAAAALPLLIAASLPATAAPGEIVARVIIAEQTMHVFEAGRLIHEWPVSTARPGKNTPTGEWNAYWLSRDHRSSLYNNAPMPYAIFYSGDYAVHGTDQSHLIGQPASAGCIRLHTENAALLFQMAQAVGLDNMRIVVID